MNAKTLVVKYVPRQDGSNSGKLLDAFLSVVGSAHVQVLDLTVDVPDLLLPVQVEAYIRRNYMGQPLNKAQAAAMTKLDRMTAQFKAADTVVVAYPMYNFSLPAVVKAYFDSVMLKGETWDINEQGYVGLMKGKRALILNTSGGVYEGAWASYEHAVSLARVEFGFMGFDPVEAIVAAGMNQSRERAPEILDRAVAQVKALAAKWYGN